MGCTGWSGAKTAMDQPVNDACTGWFKLKTGVDQPVIEKNEKRRKKVLTKRSDYDKISSVRAKRTASKKLKKKMKKVLDKRKTM